MYKPSDYIKALNDEQKRKLSVLIGGDFNSDFIRGAWIPAEPDADPEEVVDGYVRGEALLLVHSVNIDEDNSYTELSDFECVNTNCKGKTPAEISKIYRRFMEPRFPDYRADFEKLQRARYEQLDAKRTEAFNAATKEISKLQTF